MAWQKKLLRVNLTEGSCTSEELNMDWAHAYLGSRGLATKYLKEEIDPKTDPLSEANKLIFATGPLTGTAASTGGRFTVVTKSPLTGGLACSNSGGYFGAELKYAGWDLVIFEGKSANLVYLLIENDKAELKSAEEIKGKSCWDTETYIKEQNNNPQLKISSIGMAGENGVLYASIVNDLHRAAGRSGVGTVMGSKNLKAVAVRGTVGVRVHKPEAFMKAVSEAKVVLAENGVTGEGLPTYGTQVLMNVINEVGALPTKNHQKTQFEGASKISGEAMHEKRADGSTNLVANQACFSCTIACGRISKIDQGHYTIKNKPEYWKASGGLEFESSWAFGAECGVDDIEALTYVNFLCNEAGLDTISFGVTVAAAMELYQKGAITKEQTGVALEFGSAEALTTITEMTAKGEGFGKEIGLGSKRLCEKYGMPELSMAVKGQEFPAYDPRAIQGIGLAYATSNRGACHLRGYTVASEILGIPEKTDPLASEGKAGLVKAFQDATGVFDSAGICIFSSFAWTLDDVQPQIAAACEGDFSLEKLLDIGERIWNMEREFNLAAGWTHKDDTLPKRLLTEGGSGPAEGRVFEIDKMLPEYYELRGWTSEGVPKAETKERLNY